MVIQQPKPTASKDMLRNIEGEGRGLNLACNSGQKTRSRDIYWRRKGPLAGYRDVGGVGDKMLHEIVRNMGCI